MRGHDPEFRDFSERESESERERERERERESTVLGIVYNEGG